MKISLKEMRDKMNDLDLLNGIKKRDISSYENLIDKYAPYIARVVYRVSQGNLSNEDIEEISSDVFFKIWQSSHKINMDSDNLKAYLGTIARNKTIDLLRSKNKTYEFPLDEIAISTHETPEKTLLAREELISIKNEVNKLNSVDKEIFIRRFFYLEKVKDIAKNLGLNPNTVSSKICRAKEQLEYAFSNKEDL